MAVIPCEECGEGVPGDALVDVGYCGYEVCPPCAIAIESEPEVVDD